MRRAVLGILLAAVLLGTGSSVAAAHANLRSSDPQDGASLDHAPSAITLTFTERPDPALSSVEVLDPAGGHVPTGPLQPVPGDATSLRASFPSHAGNGVYTVTWRTVSAVDGHFTTGTITFGIGATPPTTTGAGPKSVAPAPTATSVLGRLLLYLGLSLLLATAVVGRTVFRGAPPALNALLAGGWLATAAGAVTMTFAERDLVGFGIGTLLRSQAGHPFDLLLAGTIVCGIAALVHARRPSLASAEALGAVAAATMLARVWGSHAAATGSAPYRIALQWLHFAGAGVWIGGVFLLALWFARPPGSDPSPIDVALGVSRWALIGLSAVVVTGVLRSLQELGGVSGWLHAFASSYGTVLAIKVAAGAVLIGLGGINRYRSIPRLRSEGDRRLLARLATTEVAIAVGVFALTGLLTGLAPPAGGSTAATRQLVVTGHDFATTTRVRLEVTPGTAGRNTFTATITDFDSGAPVKASTVTLRFVPRDRPDVAPGSLPLARGPGGTWTGTGSQLSLDGTWDVGTQIQVGTGTVVVPLVVTTLPPQETITVSRASGQPDITTITLPSGISVQSYADPGTPGPNELHYTAFDASGTELPISSITVTATPPSEGARELKPRRLSAGHFVFDATLSGGRWGFDSVATAKDGTTVHVTWGVTVG
jgi:copper transport protein